MRFGESAILFENFVPKTALEEINHLLEITVSPGVISNCQAYCLIKVFQHIHCIRRCYPSFSLSYLLNTVKALMISLHKTGHLYTELMITFTFTDDIGERYWRAKNTPSTLLSTCPPLPLSHIIFNWNFPIFVSKFVGFIRGSNLLLTVQILFRHLAFLYLLQGGGGGGVGHLNVTWMGGAHFLRISTNCLGKNLHSDALIRNY